MDELQVMKYVSRFTLLTSRIDDFDGFGVEAF